MFDASSPLATPLLDVNGNNQIEPIDALIVINYLNNQLRGEGEQAIAIIPAKETAESGDQPDQLDETIGVISNRKLRSSPITSSSASWASTVKTQTGAIDQFFADLAEEDSAKDNLLLSIDWKKLSGI
ncbi:MAG: dockerin type I domain-containing protein [Pirellulaceae bacterium]